MPLKGRPDPLPNKWSHFVHWLKKRIRRTPGESWIFPHGLLAILVGLLGLRNVLPLFEQIHIIQYSLATFGPAEDFAHLPGIFHIPGGVSKTIIGLVQILMSVGLLLRSRMIWTIVLLMTMLTVTIDLFQRPLPHFSLVFAVLLLGALILFRKTFDQSSLAIGTFLSVLSILLLMGYGIFGSFILGKGFVPPIQSLTTAFYFAIITMATVGYGDIVPRTDDARLFVVSLVILGITVFSASLSSVIIPMMNDRIKRALLPEKKMPTRKNHTILVGTGPLARSTYQELTARNYPVTIITPHEISDPPFAGCDQVIGDPADGEVLRRAGVIDAQAIISLLDEDAENAFVVLAARDTGSKAKTVVSVRSRANFTRIRTVNPDMILAPDLIGGELIAMALNDEKIDGETYFRKALFMDPRIKEGVGE